MTFLRADDWYSSDLHRELGDRVRWPLLQENGPQPANLRAFDIAQRAFLSEPRPKSQIVDVTHPDDVGGCVSGETVERGTETSGALFSADDIYRYALWRDWTPPWTRKPLTIAFVMLNPSTADEHHNDPTIRRCIRYAKDWGYDRLHVVNLFALRATDPKVMAAHAEPEGPENEWAIRWYAGSQADLTIAAWGAFAPPADRLGWLRELVAPRAVRVLGLTRAGEPRHPLYMRKECGHHDPSELVA